MSGGVHSESPLSLSDHYEYGNGIVHQLEGRMRTLRQQLSNHIDQCLLEAFSEIVHLSNNHVALKDKKKEIIKPERKRSGFGEKVFAYRRSTFSELFEITHFRTLQNIFVAVIICWAINTAINDAIVGGHWRSALPELELIYWAFGNFSVVAYGWVFLMVAAIAIYPLFQSWIFVRSCFSDYKKVVDSTFLGLWILYEILFVVIPCRYIVIDCELPSGSAVAFTCEQTRLLMKIHAFVRENIRRFFRKTQKREDEAHRIAEKLSSNLDDIDNGQEVRQRKISTRSSGEARSRSGSLKNVDDKSDTNSVAVADPPHNSAVTAHFSNYLYFLFAPTLVYRDNYPRTSHINWLFVFTNFSQVVLCVCYCYYLISRYLMPEVLALAGSSEVSISLFIVCWSRCATPGILLFVLAHYGFLHSWLNAFAEMLRFGDREFYKDWWNAVSFSAYYRDWNRVVHDWLHAYVYSDVIRILGSGKRALAASSVFFLSCFFHQYILVSAMRFYLPFFEFSMFITGMLAIFVTPKASNRNRPLNVAMWVAMIFGNALMICVYTMEWSARGRYESAFPNDGIADLFVPRCVYSTFAKNTTLLLKQH